MTIQLQIGDTIAALLPGGDYGNYVPYTAVFVNGESVALSVDSEDLTHV